jgi:hypothetical protein
VSTRREVIKTVVAVGAMPKAVGASRADTSQSVPTIPPSRCVCKRGSDQEKIWRMAPCGGGYADVAPTTHPKARHENHQLSCLDLPERSYFRKRTLTGGTAACRCAVRPGSVGHHWAAACKGILMP